MYPVVYRNHAVKTMSCRPSRVADGSAQRLQSYWVGNLAIIRRIFPTASIPAERCATSSCLQIFCEESGNEAKTLWERIKRKDDRTWVDFTPVTGRTHQVCMCMHSSRCEADMRRSVHDPDVV